MRICMYKKIYIYIYIHILFNRRSGISPLWQDICVKHNQVDFLKS